MDNIVIGKLYRLHIRPNPEYACRSCGSIHGERWLQIQPEAQGVIVKVRHQTGENVQCSSCKEHHAPTEGMYIVSCALGIAYVPYPWLEPLVETEAR